MRMSFGEGMAPVISGDRLILVFDYEGDSFMVVLDKSTGKEVWRMSRDEKSTWAAPLVVDFGDASKSWWQRPRRCAAMILKPAKPFGNAPVLEAIRSRNQSARMTWYL